MGANEHNIWSPDQLKMLMDARFKALERERDMVYKEQKEALEKALTSIDRRLEQMNEFRSQLRDQQGQYLTRNEYDAKHETLVQRIGEREETISKLQGRTIGSSSTVATFITVGAIAVTIIIAVVTILLTR